MNQVTLNPKDIPGLKKFFQTYGHLSTNDQAQISNLSADSIRRLRKRAGIAPKVTTARPPLTIRQQSIPSVTPPPDWRHDRAWLEKMVKIYSVSQIARMVERSRALLMQILAKHGIKGKTLKEATRSKNKHCTHAWCYKHYVQLALSQQQCANLAGISQQVFSVWLNLFKITVRDQQQTELGRTVITLWEKDFIAKLRQNSTVRRVFVREGYIHVRYMNYFWENYYTRAVAYVKRPYTYFAITEENTRINKVPLVYHEYGVDIEGKPLHPAHICLSRPDLKKATLVEQRLAIHEYARQIITRGWIQPSFPPEVLQEDYDKISNTLVDRYINNEGYTAFPKFGTKVASGRKLMMHFFDFSPFWSILARPQKVIRYLNFLAQKSVKFNLYNLLMVVASGQNILPSRMIPNLPSPAIYTAIFKHLKLQGTLLDINVGFGNRAVAAASAGLKYTTADPKFSFALERGFPLFTGLDYEPYSNQQVDIAIYDNGFKMPDMEKVLPYLGVTKKLLVFCAHAHLQEMLKYKPQTAIKVRVRYLRKTPDYLFVW